MNLYKLLFPAVFFFLLTSCSEKQPTTEQPQKAESTGEIVDQYVNTLTTAKDKARNVAGAADNRLEEADKTAQDMDKQ